MPKCVIKARDPRLQQINVAAPGFLITGPIPEDVLTTNCILEGKSKLEASFSHPIIKEKEKEQEEEEEEEIVEASDSKDDFEVFNQPLSLEIPLGDLIHSSLA